MVYSNQFKRVILLETQQKVGIKNFFYFSFDGNSMKTMGQGCSIYKTRKLFWLYSEIQLINIFLFYTEHQWTNTGPLQPWNTKDIIVNQMIKYIKIPTSVVNTGCSKFLLQITSLDVFISLVLVRGLMINLPQLQVLPWAESQGLMRTCSVVS